MTEAASVVHSVAPDALIYFSGLNFDVTISPIPLGLPLNGTTGTSTEGKVAYFNPSDLPFSNKIVLELHKYDFEHTQASCKNFEASLYDAGYSAIDIANPAVKYHLPMMFTEWGLIQDGLYWNTTTYNQCLIEFFEKWKPSGWMQWELAGSFYVQTRAARVQDAEEAWGLVNHNWTAFRSKFTIKNSLEALRKATLV